MAGSLEMMIHDVKEIEGDFTSPFALLDNMGDAYEACEEAVAEIERLRAALAKSCEEGRDEMYDCGYNRLRSALKQLDSLAQDAKNVRIMRQAVRKIVRDALREASDE